MSELSSLAPFGGELTAGLAAVAFATSMLSAILGLAGGITLLSVMLLFMEPLTAVPLHGVVQLVANGSRTWIQRREVHLELVWPYALCLLPAGFAGLTLARGLAPDHLRALIGAFVLLATWAPAGLRLGRHPERIAPRRRFLLLGATVGFLNTTVGATGALLAPFFLNLGLNRFAIIGTQAACQTLGHLAKLVVFGVVGFAFSDYALLLVLLAGMVVAGTWTGSQLLTRVKEGWFVALYKGVLTLIALRLVLSAIVS